MTLRPIGIPHASQGLTALALQYNIRNDPPNNYVGFDRTLPEQDWSRYSRLCLWVESDGSGRNLVLQFGTDFNNRIKQNQPLDAAGPMDVCMGLRDASGTSSIDLRRIAYYGVYVEGPPTGGGRIYIDDLRVVR